MKKCSYIIRALIIGLLSVQLVSCGTLIYPERRGHKVGNLDAGVVILDAIGLLFGLIPGLIAFAVDFSTGCIYLPASAANGRDGKYRVVKFDPKNCKQECLEATIKNETGVDLHFNDGRIQYKKLKNVDELSLHFERFQDERVALSSAVVR